jgi:hypothetical protein
VSANGQQVAPGHSTADTVAAYLATFVFYAAPVSAVYYPGRVGPGAMLVALIAAGIARAPSRIVAWSVAWATTWWLIGMVIAVSLDRSLF